MKIVGKVLGLMVVGLLTVGVVYPLLHEAGHALATLVVGGEVEEWRLMPTASVLCRMPTSEVGIAAVGMGGTLFPALVAAVMPHRRFWGWFVRFILLTVCLISLAVPLITLWMSQPLPSEDLAQVVAYAPCLAGVCCGLFAAVWTVTAVLWWRARPLEHWVLFLNPPQAKSNR